MKNRNGPKEICRMSNKSDDFSRRIIDDVPSEASLWRREHLNNLGIVYRRMLLSDLTESMISNDIRKSGSGLPKILIKITELVKNVWSFSVDASEIMKSTRYVVEQIQRMRQEFVTKCINFRQDNTELILDECSNGVFNDWCSRMKMFMNWLGIFLTRLRDQEIQEGLYTQLLMQFTMICMLQPEIGECYEEHMRIKGTLVSSVPDIRFPKFSNSSSADYNGTVGIVTVGDAEDIAYTSKRCHRPGFEGFDIHNVLSHGLLGEHGAELLIGTKKSCFKPRAYGMICVDSKIIFTYLTLDSEHRKTIKRQSTGKESCESVIHYTRPFDFLDVRDHNDIFETLFFLGYIQSAEYELVK